MKTSFEKIHKKMTKNDRLYGTTTMGSRGQVVIPAEARRDLKLRPGDQLLVMGKFNRALGLVKIDELDALVDVIMKNFSGTGQEKKIKERIQKIFSKANISNSN